jgi:hypothetical protein
MYHSALRIEVGLDVPLRRPKVRVSGQDLYVHNGDRKRNRAALEALGPVLFGLARSFLVSVIS